MTDFMNPTHPVYGKWSPTKKDAVISRLISLINEVAVVGISVTLNVVDFDNLDPEDKALCGNNPYALAASQCIGYTVKVLEEGVGLDADVYWVIATGDDGGKAFFKQMNVLPSSSTETLKIAGVVPGLQKTWPPLDAADFLAWCEMNRSLKFRDTGHEVVAEGYLARIKPGLRTHYMAGQTLLDWAREDLGPREKESIKQLFGVHSRGSISPQKRERWSRPYNSAFGLG